jgi:hypothetical protein
VYTTSATGQTRASRSPFPGPSSPLGGGAESGAEFGWRDPWLRACVLLALALQAWTLSRVEGYQLADSVEYMDRAEQFVRGESLHASTVRSFAFSALLAPVFALLRLFAVDEPRIAVGLVRALVVLLGTLALVTSARIAARALGRAAGLGCAFAIACCPIYLRYSIEPLSASAAFCACSYGTWHLFGGGGFARGLRAGAWLGAAVLMAFQCIPIALALFVVAFFARVRRERAFCAGWVVGFGVLLLVQCFLDQLVYGAFGSSLWAYVVENAGYNIAGLLNRAGLRDWSEAVYRRIAELDQGIGAQVGAAGTAMRSRTPPWWYFVELPRQAFAWPALALLALGLVRVLARGRALGAACAFALAANLLVMSTKGEKTFRLWMPLLPYLGLCAGAGIAWLHGATVAGTRTWRRALVALLCVATLGGALRIAASQNLRKFGGYWRAIELVNAAARRENATPAAPQTVCSVYHWATQFRAARGVQPIKLPHHLEQWKSRSFTDDARAACLRELGTFEWVIGHLQVFEQDRALMQVVNDRYAIVDVLYDRTAYEEMAPIYVLRVKERAPGARTFFELHTGVDAAAYQAALAQPTSVDYRRRTSDGAVQQIVLLGWDVERGTPEQQRAGLFWITYHWFAGPLAGRNYTVADRFTDPRDGSFQNNHAPAYGCLPTSEWRPGSILRETWLLELPHDPVEFGGPWRRGTRLPIGLWVALPEYDAQDQVVGGLVPFRASGTNPYPRAKRFDPASKRDGRRWSDDGFMQIGGFALPLPASWRLPDDGRVIPEPGAARD